MRIRMQTYGPSVSARDLARGAGIRRLLREGSRFRSRASDWIVNWGSSQLLHPNANYLNHPDAVKNAADKRRAFEIFTAAGVPHPEWTDDANVARGWFDPYDNSTRVITRALTRGSRGRGTEVYSYRGTSWTKDYNAFLHAEQVPLYVKVFGDVQENEEFRVHVWNGEVIDVVQKRRRRTEDETRANPYIRSYGNGWVFCREDIRPGEVLLDAAVQAVAALGLDFGAVDCAQHRGSACVYEVNTAPGLEGTTLSLYSERLADWARHVHQYANVRPRLAGRDVQHYVGGGR